MAGETVLNESSLVDYENINQIELLLTTTSSTVAMHQADKLRRQNDGRMKIIEGNYRYFSPYRRKLHDLHVQKLAALEDYIKAWKRSEYGPDRVQALAEKDKALFVLSKTNEALDTLLTGGGSLSSIASVEDMEKRLRKTTANFVVTSSYLMVGNQRLKRGEPIWVIDVAAASAKVLHMGRGYYAEPACGWVSIYDLERRSNWRSDPAFFYSPPTTVIYETRPQPTVKVVVVGQRHYPYRYDRHDRRGGHDKHDKHRRDGPDDHRRRYDHIIIDPRFW
ncbi:MAG: hypothetical protein PHV05_10110 [Candidatus Riflebacteria bacterium]|nr:hypothetical protein [Candidatus Riflebacteria bacterium]